MRKLLNSSASWEQPNEASEDAIALRPDGPMKPFLVASLAMPGDDPC
jgi:hypothetical protein